MTPARVAPGERGVYMIDAEMNYVAADAYPLLELAKISASGP